MFLNQPLFVLEVVYGVVHQALKRILNSSLAETGTHGLDDVFCDLNEVFVFSVHLWNVEREFVSPLELNSARAEENQGEEEQMLPPHTILHPARISFSSRKTLPLLGFVSEDAIPVVTGRLFTEDGDALEIEFVQVATRIFVEQCFQHFLRLVPFLTSIEQ
jgi:hypothetical protein